MDNPATKKARIALAIGHAVTAQATLRVWLGCLAAETDIGAKDAGVFQVSLRAIAECIEQATNDEPDYENGLHFMCAGGLVSMAEGALWQKMSGDMEAPLHADDLRQTVGFALRLLAQGCEALKALQVKGDTA